MADLLQQLRLERYRLDVLRSATPSPAREAAIISAESALASLAEAIRARSTNNP